MLKLANLNFDGDLLQGVRALMSIRVINPGNMQEDNLPDIDITEGALPQNQRLLKILEEWSSNYRLLNLDLNNTQRSEFQNLERELRSHLDSWMLSEPFRPIRDKWQRKLMEGEVQIIVSSTNHNLLRLPWYLCELVEKGNPHAEVALSIAEEQHIISKPPVPTLRDKVRILVVSSDDSEAHIAQNLLFHDLADIETHILIKPQHQDIINDELWNQEWDILFFSGYSSSHSEQGKIWINQTESLSITELKSNLHKVVEKGLQLAIFNSPDGIKLIPQLTELHIPRIIVMREPVHNQVAKVFFTHLLNIFAKVNSFYLAEREARTRLQGLEDQFPSASWLPIIFQNLNTAPLTWQTLGKHPTHLCPYRGLSAFREEDARFFYGRENVIKSLIEKTQQHSLVAIIGPSGSGKSSVVFAGLVAHLRQQNLWRIASFCPGNQPFQALAEALLSLKHSQQTHAEKTFSTDQFVGSLRSDETTLLVELEAIISENPEKRVLFIIDQFEELYALCQEHERQIFLDRFLKATKQSRATFVLTMRADFLDQALGYRPFANALQQRLLLGSMSHEELKAAIEKPAELLGAVLEKGLAERMVNAVIASDSGDLPLLEFTLYKLWEKRQGLQLTHMAYDEIGGVEESAVRYAEQIYGEFSELEQNQVQQIFLQLVQPGEERGTEDTRRLATRAEVGEKNWKLVAQLASDRLVITDQDRLELVHEALIKRWNRLREWIIEHRNFRLWQERLRDSIQRGELLQDKLSMQEAKKWLNERTDELTPEEQDFIQRSLNLQKKDEDRVKLQKILLAASLGGITILFTIAGVRWCYAVRAATNDRIRNLISESRSLFDQSNQGGYDSSRDRSSRFFDKKSSQNSSSLDTIQNEMRREEEEKARNQEDSFKIASLKAIKAGREIQGALFGVDPDIRLQGLEVLQRIASVQRESSEFELSECKPFKRGPISVVTSSDRKTTACINYDGTVKLWDIGTGKKTNIFRGDSEWIDAAEFSPDGELIASGSVDGTVKLWNRTTGKEVCSLKGGLSQVSAIQFSPDGQKVAAARYDGTITVWETKTGKQLKVLPEHAGIGWIFFSPNSKVLASGGNNKTIKLWDVSTGKELITFRSEQESSEMGAASFTPDGKNFAYSISSPGSQKIKIWSVESKQMSREIPVYGKPYFSPDGKTVVTVDEDNTNQTRISNSISLQINSTSPQKSSISLWDILTGKRVKIVKNLPGTPSSISFGLDGKSIAIYIYKGFPPDPNRKSSGTIILWDKTNSKITTMEQSNEIFEMLDFNFSPNGQKIAISSFGSIPKKGNHMILNLWDTKTGRELKTLINEPIVFTPERIFTSMGSQFSPDGKTVLVNNSGIVKFFDSSSGEELNIPNVSSIRDLRRITSSDDGKVVVTPRTDGSLQIQDKSTGAKSKINRFDSLLVSAAHISDDNEIITTVNWHGMIQQRELTTGRAVKSINLPFDKFASSLAFSPDGRMVAAARTNYTVKVWEVVTGKEITTLKEYANIADENNDWRRNKVSFSPNGKLIAILRKANSEDNFDPKKGGQLELWEIASGKAIQLSNLPIGIKNISFDPDSNTLAILRADDKIQIWSLSSLQLVQTIASYLDNADFIQFDHNGKSIFAKGSNRSNDELKMLNVETGREIVSFNLSNPSTSIDSVNLSSDEKELILRNDHKFITLNLDLEDLLKRSCDITRDYLKSNPNLSNSDKHLCDSP
jgi:WD40 repeat protein/energy-coupling factor transporter ATP-binding protein EcfA2